MTKMEDNEIQRYVKADHGQAITNIYFDSHRFLAGELSTKRGLSVCHYHDDGFCRYFLPCSLDMICFSFNSLAHS